MANQRRPSTSIGMDSIVQQGRAARQFQEPTLAQQVAAAAARKGWLTPPAAPASHRQPRAPQASVPPATVVPETPAPETWTGIINRLTGDNSDYTADPETARAFGRLFPTAGTPDWHYSSPLPQDESTSRTISRKAGQWANAFGNAAPVAAAAGLFPPAAPAMEPLAAALAIASAAATGTQIAADTWTAWNEGGAHPFAKDLPGAAFGLLAGQGAKAYLKSNGRVLSKAEEALLNAGINAYGQAASVYVDPDRKGKR